MPDCEKLASEALGIDHSFYAANLNFLLTLFHELWALM